MWKVVTGAVVVLAIFVALYLTLMRGHDDGAQQGRSLGSSSEHTAPAPSLPGSAATSDPSLQTKFQERKMQAMSHLREDLDRRLLECGAGRGSGVAKPRRVRLSLDRDGSLSTPELQRFIVSSADVADSDGSISDESRGCLQRFVGAAMNLLLQEKDLPVQHLTETILLPLR